MKLKTLGCAAALGFAGLFGSSAQAAVVMDFSESGADVILSISGSFNLNTGSGIPAPVGGLTFTDATSVVDPGSVAGVRTGAEYAFRTYGNTGPSSIGTGTSTVLGGIGIGDVFMWNWRFNNLGVAVNYVSGSALSGSATFSGTDFASLGLSEGSYVWDFNHGEQITLNVVGASAVPLPAGGLLLLGGLAAFGAMRRKA